MHNYTNYLICMKTTLLHLFLFLLCLKVSGQNADSMINKIGEYFYIIDNFTEYIPQEKVYLQFDNTSYYQSDNIWFKCYIVTSGLYKATELSKTLYVELLNPGGEIIDKQILKIENGQCHGSFTLNRLPFYTGFYEVRAYTKYMLNFGDDVIFSRLLPVFNKPKKEGNYEEKSMLKYGYGNYPKFREKPLKEKKVNLKFYPEGGYLIEGIPSQVAFEATDTYGNPIDITGSIMNKEKEEIFRFTSTHEGRGVFTYTPTDNKQQVVINYNNKEYTFDMPEAQSQGMSMNVDNLSYPDSIKITLQKNKKTPVDMLGLAIINRGKLNSSYLIDTSNEELIHLKVEKSNLQSGVSWIVLFDSNGRILCDRLIFIYKDDLLNIKARTDKEKYKPYEAVNIEFSLTDKENNPVQVPFSLSVKDGMNEIEYNHNILTDLLLMSEIKGYVRNPSYYFEADDSEHRAALDLLLMVQGWRRYSWEQITLVESFDLKHTPEKGIETHGQVVSFIRKRPRPNVDISSFLLPQNEDEDKKAGNFQGTLTTDSLGKFSFVSDLYGKWHMLLAVTEKGKRKDHRIILDRLFSPEPKRYRYTDMQINISETNNKKISEEIKQKAYEYDTDSIISAYVDSLVTAGIKEDIYHLSEVTVTAKKRSKEKDIYNNRSKAIAYYDVPSELDDITDRGDFIGNDIHELLKSMNKNFFLNKQVETLIYKGKKPLFVINYEPTMENELDQNKYKNIRLAAIKAIYINENFSSIFQYADPQLSIEEISKLYSCVVFIETYPDGKIPVDAGKGLRKTWLEGYSQVKEFYSPDYSILQPEPDYRRTLYWNPSVTPDKEGKAKVRFYNNSGCKNFKISAETITPQGTIGVYKDSFFLF